MNESLKELVKRFLQVRRHRKMWEKIVGSLAVVVVFVTSYMLILPAITMEKTTYCGNTHHTHTASCYEPSEEILDEDDISGSTGSASAGISAPSWADSLSIEGIEELRTGGEDEGLAEAESESETESESESESETESESESESEIESENESESESELKSERESKYESKSGFESESESETDIESEHASVIASESESESKSGSGSEPETESEPESESEFESESESETGSVKKTVVRAEKKSETETETEAETKAEEGTEAESKAFTEATTESEATTEMAAELESESETESMEAYQPVDAEMYASIPETYVEDGIALLDESPNEMDGLNITGKITNMVLKKKDGVVWKQSDSFTVDDQIKATVDYENINVDELKQNGNKAYIQLPKGVNCSYFANKTYELFDNGTKSGNYHYVKGEDEHWYIQLDFLPDYVQNAGETIGGSIQFEFQFDKTIASEEGKRQDILIGKWSGEVTVKKDRETEKETEAVGEDSNYELKKSAGKLSYQEGIGYYIDYTVEVIVKKDQKAPITLNDQLTGKGWEYLQNSLTISGTDVPKYEWKLAGDEAKRNAEIIIGELGATVKAGTYKVTYRIYNSMLSSVNDEMDQVVKNSISLADGDKKIERSISKSTTCSTINKEGEVKGENYIDWTVYLNTGEVVKNLTSGATFNDTIPADLEIMGDVIVEQYDVTGTLKSTAMAKVNGRDISYEIPTGQYYYVIKYRTKTAGGQELPIGGKEISNTGTVEGDIKGSDTGTVNVSRHVLDKSFVRQTVTEKAGKWVDIIDWQTQIKVDGSLKGYVYQDYAGLSWLNVVMTLTPEQMQQIKVIDASGKEISRALYQVSEYDHEDNGVKNGLFQITFSEGVTGPVTIKYQTTADLTDLTIGQWMSFVNYAIITDGKGNQDKDQDSSQNIQYRHGSPEIIYKYGTSYDTSKTSGTITLEPGQRTIPWTIIVNGERKGTVSGDLVITDEIADDMTLLEDTVKIAIEGKSGVDVTWNYDKGNRKLTVNVPASAYASNTPITISYRTELDEAFFTGSEMKKSYTNTASVEQKDGKTDSTYTQHVTRRVVGKSGSYDATNKMLSYNIIINPDSSELNAGQMLTVRDHLDGGKIDQNVQLVSLKLFTALKTTDANGNTIISPGKWIKDLIRSDKKELYNYSYEEATNSFETYVSDKTAYVLIAQYEVDAELNAAVTMKNTVELIGSSSWSKTDESTSVTGSTSGTTYTNDKIVIIKHDAAKYNTLLSGAEFELAKYQNDQWSGQETLTTGEKGQASQKAERNVLYRLVETKAPNEYVLNSAPYYFIIVQEGQTEINLPDQIAGDNNYKKADVVIYQVKKYETIEIHRYNEEDITIIKPGQIRVNKIWKDANGNEITDAVKLDKVPEITVTLEKYAPQKGHTIWVKNSNGKKILAENIADGATVQLLTWWKDEAQFAKIAAQMPGGTQFNYLGQDSSGSPHKYEITNVRQDIIFDGGGMYDNSVTDCGHIGGATAIDIVKTIVGSVTLNAENNWNYLWTNLEKGDNIKYVLVEEPVDGYTASYQLNGEALSERIQFSVTDNGDRVTVTNKKDGSSYTLPETGGSGTLPYMAGGIAVLASGLLYGYSLRRRRERRMG